jgi:signal transduction histidine kinase
MVSVSETAGSIQDEAVSALLAITSCDGRVSRGDAAATDLVEAARSAAQAGVALAWTADPEDPAGRVVAVAGLSDEQAGRVGLAVAELGVSGDEREIAPGGAGGALGAELATLGAPAALLLPVSVAEVPGGVLLLAGTAPPAAHPVRRHAARVAAGRIGTLLDGMRLRANLERAMAQILATDERMLGRMGLDIHDGPTQQLSVAMLEVQLLEADLADAEGQGKAPPESLRPAIARIYETVGGALHEMRELIGHLRPAQFEDRRLTDILQDAVVAFEARTDCRVEPVYEGDFPINGVSITQRITLYRILQETLTNAHRHGRASHVRVRVTDEEGGIALEVADDGAGFDPAAVQRRRPGMPLARFGLHGMRDRAQILGGTFEISSAPGEGALVRVFLPRWKGPAPEVPVDVA